MLHLVQVLSPILSPADLHSIFGRVAALFSKSLAEAFSRLEPRVTISSPFRAYHLQHAHICWPDNPPMLALSDARSPLVACVYCW